MSKFRWGVLGTGRIASWFCQDLRTLADAEVAAVGSRSLESAAAFAQAHAIPSAYASYEAVCADPTIDAVYVATPHTLHAANSLSALRAGKAVLCEKPLTTSAAECEALIAAARQSGGYLMEAMWTYFLPAIETAKRWVDDGLIGRLSHVRAELGYPVAYSASQREYDAGLGGGCLLEMGIYPVALARLFAGQAPRVLHAVGRRAANGVEDDVAALFDYGDVTAALTSSFRCRLPNAAYVVGEEGYVVIPDAFRARECHLHRLDDRVQSFYAPRTTRGYEHQAVAVQCDLSAGLRESPRMPLSLSLAFQRDIEAIRAHI